MRNKMPHAVRAKKYGLRIEERGLKRQLLFKRIEDFITERAEIKSDSNPHYVDDVRIFFPLATHKRFEGKRGASTAQGELKRVRFDPLFSLNHTCAKMRADINRLFRRTWCTTKKKERLYAHLMLYANYHNQNLTQ